MSDLKQRIQKLTEENMQLAQLIAMKQREINDLASQILRNEGRIAQLQELLSEQKTGKAQNE